MTNGRVGLFLPLSLIAFFSIALMAYTLPGIMRPCRPHEQHSSTTSQRSMLMSLNQISMHPYLNFTQALQERSGPDGVIILALVDEAFVDMAVNLYLTSFQPHFIEEFLFVGAGRRACDLLSQRDLSCVVYTEDKDSAKASEYNSVDFKRKMNIRTSMIIEALGLGFTVIHTDLDVIFLKNPVPVLIKTAADIATLWDSSAYNAGFVLVRPTSHGKGIYTEMERITKQNPSIDDQKAMNAAINTFKSKKNFKAVVLDKKNFLCGLEYFEKGNRYFPTPCDVCIVVHNNWIVSKEAKVYRFKEHFMWKLDNDGYYSSTVRKYISYNNPLQFTLKTTELELGALKSALALGRILNRTIILPKFHCNSREPLKVCPLNALVRIRDFDKQFRNAYRESTFISNHNTPYLAESQPQVILTPAAKDLLRDIDMDGIESHTEGSGVVYSGRIAEWFANRQEALIRFHSLYAVRVIFNNTELNEQFEAQLKKAYVKSDYRQLS